jgi:Uma2 family endonuclease
MLILPTEANAMSTVTLTAKQAFLLERWHQILNDPELDQYENFRIETDGNGKILMSPRPPKPHNFKATKIATMLVERLGGEAAIEPQIITGDGVKVPDVCWLHPDRYAEASDPDPFIIAPEICVEVLSPSNTPDELEHKRGLYFAAGAIEVWICDRNNNMTFYGPTGVLTKSGVCPDFPSRLPPPRRT